MHPARCVDRRGTPKQAARDVEKRRLKKRRTAVGRFASSNNRRIATFRHGAFVAARRKTADFVSG